MKRNNKGYTLIEILLVVSLGIIITTITVISFISIRNKQKEKDYINMVENVKTASELYLKDNNVYKTKLETDRIINLPIINLVDSGYLDEYYTTNPITNISIKHNCLIVSLGEQKEYEFGEIRNCGAFLKIFPNPLIIHKGNPYNLLEGVVAYDKNGNKVSDPVIRVDPQADTKINDNNNVNKEIEITYEYEEEIYLRKIKILLNEVEIDKDTKHEILITGRYQIIAYGAQGSGNGGKGGQVIGEARFEKGNILDIKIGTTTNGGNGQFPGGGATIVKLNKELLIGAAGGGGGESGTYGGNNNGSGGKCGINYDASSCVDGSNGDNFGTESSISGGGSSGNYKSCSRFKEEWNPCISGSNTCEPGYIEDTNTCIQYNACSSCGCKTYGTKWDPNQNCTTKCSGGYEDGTCLEWNYDYSGSCKCYHSKGYRGTSCTYSVYIQGCDSYCRGRWSDVTYGTGTCKEVKDGCSRYSQIWNPNLNCYNECAGGYVPDTENCTQYNACSSCGCKTYETKYSSCATGSNTCVGGNAQTTECEVLGDIKYNSGSGGKNYINSIMQLLENNQGVRENNGLVKIKFLGE